MVNGNQRKEEEHILLSCILTPQTYVQCILVQNSNLVNMRAIQRGSQPSHVKHSAWFSGWAMCILRVHPHLSLHIGNLFHWRMIFGLVSVFDSRQYLLHCLSLARSMPCIIRPPGNIDTFMYP